MTRISFILSVAGACLISGTAAAQGSDNCATAQPISGQGSFAFDTTVATQDGLPDPMCYKFGTSQIDHDVWFAWTPDETCDFTINTCNTTLGDTKIAIYNGTSCPAMGAIDCNDDTCGLQSQVAANLTGGQTYLIRVGSFPGASGATGSINISGINCVGVCPDNDDCSCATSIAGEGIFDYDNSNATMDGAGDALCYKFGTSQIDADVWYAWTPNVSGNYSVTTCNLAINDTKIAIYDGADCATSSITDCNDDTCGLQSQVTGSGLVSGVTYLIRIGSFPGGSTGAGQFEIEQLGGGGDNNDCGNATPISGTGTFPFDNTNATMDGGPSPLCYKFGTSQIDNDVWFAWTAPCNGDYTVTTCNGTLIDSKIAIYDGDDCATSSITDCNDDTCGLQSQVSGNGLIGGETYLIRIGSFPGGSSGTGTFDISGGAVSANYCIAGVNSSGATSDMSFTGSNSVAANDLVIHADDTPVGSFAGQFVMGDTQAMVPFVSGFLCIDLSTSFFRLNPIINQSAGGTVSRAVDNTTVPASVIVPGSTWNFQYWYRDMPFDTNLSDGLSICFAP